MNPQESNKSVSLTKQDLCNLVTDQVKQQTEALQVSLLDNIDRLLNKRIQDQAHEIRKLGKNIQEKYVFKRKGNEEQFKANNIAIDHIEHAEEHLKSTLEDADAAEQDNVQITAVIKAQEELGQGKESLLHRNKLIKLADLSECGWRTVQEYEAHQLAENSDDEKHILKAESRASRKQREDLRRRQVARRRFQSQALPPVSTTSPSDSQGTKPFPGRKPGICFACGKPGHWRSDCFASKAAEDDMPVRSRIIEANKKLSISNSNVICLEQNEQCSLLHESLSPVGRLKNHVEKWKISGCNLYILDVIINGYKLPFIKLPKPINLHNNASACNNIDFVDAEISKLLKLRCITQTRFAPTVVNPLTVSVNRSGKQRLVLDCRHINLFLFKYKFRCEDSECARQMINNGDFMFTFDLKSAYHHIEIYEPHREYLGFFWKSKFYVFNVLPFGVSTAAYIFTKTLRVLIKYWRSSGIRIILYLDDGIGMAKSMQSAVSIAHKVHSDLIAFGFLIAETKCGWDPLQRVQWLGHYFNSDGCVIEVTQERLDRFLQSLDTFVSQITMGTLWVCVRSLASLVGQIQSMRGAIGSTVLLRTKYTQMCIEERMSWNSKVKINTFVFDELMFWKHNVCKLNGCPFIKFETFDLFVYSDASSTGYGGYIDSIKESEHFGKWNKFEKKQSSTWRELMAVKYVLFHLAVCLEGQRIKWHVDNLNVVYILTNGSMKVSLHVIALEVSNFCSEHKIHLIPEWIPRDDNTYADSLSRFTDLYDSDEWEIVPRVFSYLGQKSGPHTFDRFASYKNAKCTRFNSKTFSLGSEGVDAFVHEWYHDFNWLVPPVKYILKVIKKLQSERAKGTLVIPIWKSAGYWPVLFPDGEPASFIVASEWFTNEKIVLQSYTNGVFAKNGVNMIALNLDFDGNISEMIDIAAC